MDKFGLDNVVSGGQRGVDRTGFDVALEIDILIGGYVPKCRWAADETVSERYLDMIEAATDAPEERTRLDVMLG